MQDADVLVIGAGPAGLATAHHLRGCGMNVIVLEAASCVGGRTRTVSLSGERVNTAAMWVYSGTESDRLCRELGIETWPVLPPTYGIHLGGRTVLATEDDDLVEQLGLAPAAAGDLRRLLSRVRAEYETLTSDGVLTEASTRLADVLILEHAGPLHPAVRAILDNAVRAGSTARPESLSAQYALRYFASYLVRSAHHRRYIPSGMQTISEALARALPSGSLHLDSPVESVTPSGDHGYTAQVASGPTSSVWTGRHVVLAVPGEAALELAPWLPGWKVSAIRQVPSNATVVLSIVVDSRNWTELDDLFFVTTVGKRFNAILQPRAAAGPKPSAGEYTYINCYLSDELDVALDDDDEGLARAWLGDFFDVVPMARGRVVATEVNRWPRCFSFPAPGREQVIAEVRRPIGGLHFTGDYASLTAGSHGALSEAHRVVAEILGPRPDASPSARHS